MKILTLRYPARCSDCGADLPAGTRAKYYGRRKIYGLSCQARPAGDSGRISARYGVYTPEGRKIGSTCGCEDYPCCGH